MVYIQEQMTPALLQQSPILSLAGYTAIIGFGGITTKDVTDDILEIDVSGIAVSEEIPQDFKTIRTYIQLLNASSIEEQRYSPKPNASSTKEQHNSPK